MVSLYRSFFLLTLVLGRLGEGGDGGGSGCRQHPGDRVEPHAKEDGEKPQT